MVNGIPVLYSRPAANSIYPGGSTEGLDDWIRPAGVGPSRETASEWADAIRVLDDPDVYDARSAASRAHIEAMNLFSEGTRIAELVEEFSRQHPAVKQIQKEETVKNAQAQPPAPGVIREPAGRAGFGFSNGRLRIQR